MPKTSKQLVGILVEPGKSPRRVEVPYGNFRDLEKVVGGSSSEYQRKLTLTLLKGTVVLFNEEGTIHDLPVNSLGKRGNLFVVGAGRGQYKSLTKTQINNVIEFFDPSQKAPKVSPREAEAVKLAKRFAVARGQYEAAFTSYFNSIPPLNMDRFWELLPVIRYTLKLHECDGKLASDEFYRKAQAKQFYHTNPGPEEPPVPSYTFYEAMQFAVRYGELTEELWDYLDKNDFDFSGDDTFEYFCDSLPLAGKEICDNLFAGRYKTIEDLFAVLRVVHRRKVEGLDKTFGEILCHGEMAIDHYLRQEAEDRFVGEVAADEINADYDECLRGEPVKGDMTF